MRTVTHFPSNIQKVEILWCTFCYTWSSWQNDNEQRDEDDPTSGSPSSTAGEGEARRLNEQGDHVEQRDDSTSGSPSSTTGEDEAPGLNEQEGPEQHDEPVGPQETDEQRRQRADKELRSLFVGEVGGKLGKKNRQTACGGITPAARRRSGKKTLAKLGGRILEAERVESGGVRVEYGWESSRVESSRGESGGVRPQRRRHQQAIRSALDMQRGDDHLAQRVAHRYIPIIANSNTPKPPIFAQITGPTSKKDF